MGEGEKPSVMPDAMDRISRWRANTGAKGKNSRMRLPGGRQLVKVGVRGSVERVLHQVPVGELDALGVPRSAGRVHDGGDVVWGGAGGARLQVEVGHALSSGHKRVDSGSTAVDGEDARSSREVLHGRGQFGRLDDQHFECGVAGDPLHLRRR